MNHLLGLIRKIIIFSLIFCTVVILSGLYYIEYELQDIDALNTVQLQVPLQIFSHDGKLIATFGEKRRVPLPYNQIPKPLIQAVLATEDQRYFQHSGVDLPGLGRATIQLLLTGRKLQGGSTITMQVARSFYLSSNKTFSRKIREILLAIKIEHKLKKEKILELYLNKVFLGNRAYGVEAAAQVYYGKHLNELTIDQFAMLAGLPKAPSTLNPLANPKAALKRRDHVLARMHDEGYIDDNTYNKAIIAPLNASYHDPQTEIKAPYVAELVRSQLEQKYGDSIYTDNLKVYTTIDSKLQETANHSVRDNLLAYDKRHGYRGPMDNWGTPSLDNMEAWQEKLRKIPLVNNLEAAAVVEINGRSITVLRGDGTLTIIPWSGMEWARRQINSDYLGPRPHRPDQIVQLGDVVRIQSTPEGYIFAQQPKAEAGLVALNPQNGAILAMVGGFDYQNSKFNRITRAERQPGSSFKPFIYSAALEKGYTLATVINDAPIVIENPTDNSLWRPQNVNHKFYGPTRLRTAIIESRNLVSIRLLALAGVPYTVNYLQKLGFARSQLPPGLSLALGTSMVTPLQMAQGYAAFANGGMKVMPFVIDSIRNSKDDVIYQAKPLVACGEHCVGDAAPAPRVISAQNAYLITSALHDVIERGTATKAKTLGRADLAGKTGTTQNQVDAWFAGYNPDIVAITWMGFDQPQSLHEYGAQSALPMWMEFIQTALKGKPEHKIEQPPGIVSIRIDPYTGQRTSARNPNGIFEYFMLPHVPENANGMEDSDAALAESTDDLDDNDTADTVNNTTTETATTAENTDNNEDATATESNMESASTEKAETETEAPAEHAVAPPENQETAAANTPPPEEAPENTAASEIANKADAAGSEEKLSAVDNSTDGESMY